MRGDEHVLERRLAAYHGLPWFLPVNVVMRVTDSDLDRLSAASWSDSAYRWVLRRIVSRLEDDAGDQAA